MKPKSSFIYYYGDLSSTSSTQSDNTDEEREEITDGNVLNMEPVIPSRPRYRSKINGDECSNVAVYSGQFA